MTTKALIISNLIPETDIQAVAVSAGNEVRLTLTNNFEKVNPSVDEIVLSEEDVTNLLELIAESKAGS